MSNSNTTPASGIGFLGLLAIAFIVLKLTNVINWSWIWVLAPIWIPVSATIVFLIVMITITVVVHYRHNSKK